MVFAAGRLTRVKGFDLLLESWALLEKDFPDWKLCIAGDGEDRENLLELIEEKGLRAAELVGRVSDMEEWYGRSAFYVLPSRDEGFGMVLIEAMSHGRAAVSFACKAGPGEIISDGENGFLVPEGDTAAFAERMRRLMESPELCREMGERASRSLGAFDREGILEPVGGPAEEFEGGTLRTPRPLGVRRFKCPTGRNPGCIPPWRRCVPGCSCL